jgi:CubicO group peptidase (beta-lactamase class C family)
MPTFDDALVPDADSVFRIASMTKSFTAATILLLRDEGRLRLDDPVAAHVPELEGWTPPTTDGDPVTLRQLLTMSAAWRPTTRGETASRACRSAGSRSSWPLTLDPESGAVTEALLQAARRTPPDDAW